MKNRDLDKVSHLQLIQNESFGCRERSEKDERNVSNEIAQLLELAFSCSSVKCIEKSFDVMNVSGLLHIGYYKGVITAEERDSLLEFYKNIPREKRERLAT